MSIESRIWLGVTAVVYTFNRRELVAQCLDSVRAQSVAPERIILVDNGSEDGTAEYLAARGDLDDPRLRFIRLERNTGASGGLATGIGAAWRDGCRFAWVMDDDVICDRDALAGLKRAYDGFAPGREPGFLVSQLVDAAGRANNVPQIDERIAAPDACAEWAEFLAAGLVRVRISTLTSILLPRATIDRCGVPSRDFFIWGEDTDYTLRITDWRPGYLVGASRAVHLRGVGGFLDIFNEDDRRRIRNFFYLYRNTTYLRRRFWPVRGLVFFLAKAMLHFCRALAEERHRLLRARMIAAGTLAGLFFRPRPEPVEAERNAPENPSPLVGEGGAHGKAVGG